MLFIFSFLSRNLILFTRKVYVFLHLQDLKKYSKGDTLNLEDEEFLNAMETIYRYPGEFTGKQISFNGFMYHTIEL